MEVIHDEKKRKENTGQSKNINTATYVRSQAATVDAGTLHHR
jgi:hypothetical protein